MPSASTPQPQPSRLSPRLEIAAFNPSSALYASASGADRIELCTSRSTGGLTPPLQWLLSVRSASSLSTTPQVPIHVMLRPRPGNDFVYAAAEFHEMQTSLLTFRDQGGADGFVFGVLLPNRTIDVARTKDLVGLAQGRPCTFHRAFDHTQDLSVALEDVIATGCRYVLTSGGAETAVEGVEVLKRLVEQARGRIEIMPGGGVRKGNVGRITKETGVRWVHSAAVVGEDGDGEEVDEEEVRGLREALERSGDRVEDG